MKQYNQTLLQLFFVISIVFLLFKIFVLRNEKSIHERIIKKEIKAIQERSNNIIKDKEKQIDYLIKKNNLISLDIKRKEKSIDSLKVIKKQIQFIYIDNIRSIKGFNARQLENYFRNEIK